MENANNVCLNNDIYHQINDMRLNNQLEINKINHKNIPNPQSLFPWKEYPMSKPQRKKPRPKLVIYAERYRKHQALADKYKNLYEEEREKHLERIEEKKARIQKQEDLLANLESGDAAQTEGKDADDEKSGENN